MDIDHTPAPWLIEEGNETIYNEKHGSIATVHDPSPDTTVVSDTQIANARLIAAAPELLAVAERLLHEDENGEITMGLIEDAQIALALAIDGSNDD